MEETIKFYNHNASEFFRDTVGLDMTTLHRRFLQEIPDGGNLLDAGCGSGRDAKVFKDYGYRVIAFDASRELAVLASEYLGQPVAVRTFADIDEIALYDGIWACASLLHLPLCEIPAAPGSPLDGIETRWHSLSEFQRGKGRAKDKWPALY